uniref:Uncharacterized protein n=1 Tax=Monopterus albus TaxID=43700 RepID=A0A3Q3JQY0_MONAL
MWVEGEDGAIPESDEESDYSSEDEGDFQYKILEKQRDDVKHKLAKLEEVSNQLLKEMDVLEIQFQIERSCRESAEALAVEVTKENKTLKRRSQMLMPFIPELPENLVAVTCDPQNDPTVNTDVVDFGEDSSDVESLLLESQAKITELQASVDGLLAEKLQLEQQIEDMTKEQDHLREQLALEVEEKEALLRKMNKQSKTMNKIKRVSQLVTEEFTDMSLKLELEEDLRQHAEVFAHQMLVQHNVVDGQNTMQSPETDLQLQQVLEEISNISTALSNIQRYCQNQVKQSQSAVEECTVLSELQNLKNQLEKSEEERKALETQLSDANGTVTRLQEEVNQLQETINRGDTNDEPKMKFLLHLLLRLFLHPPLLSAIHLIS